VKRFSVTNNWYNKHEEAREGERLICGMSVDSWWESIGPTVTASEEIKDYH